MGAFGAAGGGYSASSSASGKSGDLQSAFTQSFGGLNVTNTPPWLWAVIAFAILAFVIVTIKS